MQVVASCLLLNWRPSDATLVTSCGAMEALQRLSSLHALARLHDDARVAAAAAAAMGRCGGGQLWTPWPYHRVSTALQTGRLSKSELLSHIQVRGEAGRGGGGGSVLAFD